MKEKNKKDSLWINKIINFLGYFFIILGVYALIKTSFNYIFYSKKYPLTPVLSINPFYYYQTEEDCYQQYNYPIYDDKGKPREPNSYEKKMREDNIKNCLEKIEKQRSENKINDVWTTIFLLLMGFGIHWTKKFYLK